MEAALENAEVRDNVENHNIGLEFDPLFEGESVSESDLKGETAEEEKPAASEPSGEAENKPEETETKPEEKQPEKPPAGYVPNEALKQERQKTQSLKAELKSLQAQIDKLSKPTESDDKFKDFKILTVEEFEELQEDSPDEANVYLYKYNKFAESKASIEKQMESERQAAASVQELIVDGSQELEKIFPGFHQGKSEEATQVGQYAVDKGFDPDLLFDLTNPGTKIVTHDGNQYVLGAGAAQLVRFIKSYKDASASLNETELRKVVESELRQKIESETKKQVIDKLKTGQDEFKSLDSATTTSDKTIKQRSGIFTESEFARMSPAEQAAFLGG